MPPNFYGFAQPATFRVSRCQFPLFPLNNQFHLSFWPDEVLCGILDAPVLEATDDALGVGVGCYAAGVTPERRRQVLPPRTDSPAYHSLHASCFHSFVQNEHDIQNPNLVEPATDYKCMSIQAALCPIGMIRPLSRIWSSSSDHHCIIRRLSSMRRLPR